MGSMLVVPFGRRRLLGVVVDLAETSDIEPRAPCPADRRARGRRARGPRRARACGSRANTCPPPPAASRSCSRPARAPARPARAPAPLAARRAHRERPAGARLHRAPGPSPARRARHPRRRPGGGHGGRPPRRSRPLDAAQPRASRLRAPGERRPPAPPPARGERGRAGRQGRPHQRPVARPWRRSWGASMLRAVRCCCTGSRAAARPRSTCARWPRRSSAAARRSCSCPRSRSRRRPPGSFVERFGDAVAVMHSRLSARERYDEWWRMRAGRRGSASARARRCSRRSATSACW